MGKKVHFITLTNEEKNKLNQIIATAPAQTVTRAKILLMSDSGNSSKITTRMISSELKVSLATIQQVRKEYTEGGFDNCIYPKGRRSLNRRAIITEEKRKAIIQLIKAGPTNGQTNWTTDAICNECVKQGLFNYIAKSTMRKIIEEEGLDVLSHRSKRSSEKRDYRKESFIGTSISGVLISNAKESSDDEEQSFEVFNKQLFVSSDIRYRYAQDILLSSSKGVLRGLRYQKNTSQGKMIFVVSGEVFYVVVDLRNNSKTYGKHFAITLTGKDHKQLIVPKGFAHGYLVLSEYAEIIIKNDVPDLLGDCGGIVWNDPDIDIHWPTVSNLIINEKEKSYPCLSESKIIL
jgi:dTDP-4-dehydrorhamnose 3,5-epimerase